MPNSDRPDPGRDGWPHRTVPTEPGEVIYPGCGVYTFPAPAGTPFTITREQALACSDVAGWLRTGTSYEIELRLILTSDGMGPSALAGTGVVREPGWVMTIHETLAVLRGRRVPKIVPDVRGESVVIIDAHTGALLLNAQACGHALSVRSTIPG